MVQLDPGTGGRSPRPNAEGGVKRRYTMEQYRADVAKLYSPSRDTPRVDGALAEAIAEGAELQPAEQAPRETAAQSVPPPKGGFLPRWSGLRQRVRRGSQ